MTLKLTKKMRTNYLLGLCCLAFVFSVVADDSLDKYYKNYEKYLTGTKGKDKSIAECIVKELEDQDIAKRFGPDTLNNNAELFRNFDVFLSNAEQICKGTPTTPDATESPDTPPGGAGTPWAIIGSIVGVVVVAIAAAAGFFIMKKNKTHKPVSTNGENVEM